MVKAIHIYVADMSKFFLLNNFLTTNEKALIQQGNIVFRPLGVHPPISFEELQNKKELDDADYIHTARNAVKALQEKCNKHTHTVIYNTPCNTPFPWLSNIYIYKALLKEQFPHAQCNIFFTPSFPSEAICTEYVRALTVGWCLNFLAHFTSKLSIIYSINQIVTSLSQFSDSLLECLGSSKLLTDEEFLLSIAQYLGLSSNSGIDVTTPLQVNYSSLSRNLIWFMESINASQSNYLLCKGPQWSEQTTFLKSQQADTHALMSPELYDEFWDNYWQHEAKVFQHINTQELFAEKLEQQKKAYSTWETPKPRTLNMAIELTKLLTPDFRQKILEGSHAQENLTKSAKLCIQAIKNVHEGISHIEVYTPPKVTVITAAYNHRNFIEQNITSILEQKTNFAVEHVIADDGSTDGTQEIISEYAKKYPSITPILHKTHVGGPYNYFSLFENITSPYLALCDGDDYFTDPLKLQTQADFLDNNPTCSLVFHVAHVKYEDDPNLERLYPPVENLPRGIKPFYYLSDLIDCNLIQASSVMYRWRFKDGVPNWFRTNLFPNDWYWHLIHAEVGKIGFINKVMSVYRRHSGGVYYGEEIDRIRHRVKVGLAELNAYRVINRHFKNKFQRLLSIFASGVFFDVLMYDDTLAEKDGVAPKLLVFSQKFPEFSPYFFTLLKLLREGKKNEFEEAISKGKVKKH